MPPDTSPATDPTSAPPTVDVSAIANTPAQDTLAVVRELLGRRDLVAVRAAVSFVMKSGSRLLKSDLKSAQRRGVKLDLVFGDDFNLSQSAALKDLLACGVDLAIFEGNRGYHPKLWIFELAGNDGVVLVGSANLSSGGLSGNVEASALVAGPCSALAGFDDLYSDVLSESRPFGQADLLTYKDAEATKQIPLPRKPAASLDLLRRHIRRWLYYIEHDQTIGRKQKWRGWYLVPEHGPLDETGLLAMQTLLKTIEKHPAYQAQGSIDFSKSSVGKRNAVSVRSAAGITTKKKLTPERMRVYLLAQQILYLRTFGFIEGPTSSLTLTRDGNAFRQAGRSRRIKIYSAAVAKQRWPFLSIAYYEFLIDVLRRVPDNYLTHDELNWIVIHTYHRDELQGIVNLVASFRSLSPSRRRQLLNWAESALARELHDHAGGNAETRYRNKLRDLMIAFGTTSDVELIGDPASGDARLRLTK